MRIVILAPHPGTQGPLPKHTPILAEGLRVLGNEVVTLPWGKHADTETVTQRLIGRLTDSFKIARQLRHSTWDVLVVKTGHDWKTLTRDIVLLSMLRERRADIVVQFQGSRSDRLVGPRRRAFKFGTRRLLKRCSGVLVLSSQEAEEFTAFMPSARCRVVRNPAVPLEGDVQQEAAISRQNLGVGFLFAGRLVAEKGVLEFVDALSMLETGGWSAVIAGDGPLRDEIARRLSESALSGNAECVGYVEGAELEAIYRRSNVLVLPTYWPEGFPTVITEALMRGLAIITTPIRGAADVLVDGVNALFVPPRDSRALQLALGRFLADPALVGRMGEANLRLALEFSAESVAERYLEALGSLTSPRGEADSR